MAVLPTTNISTTLVRNALGEDNNDVGLLCTSDKINIWAKFKPHSLAVPSGAATGPGLNSHGIYRTGTSSGSFTYARPAGGATDPYRLGDFRQYNTKSYPPVTVTIDSVYNVTESSCVTPVNGVYTLINGYTYRVQFDLFAGEIKPSEIHPETVETKNTEIGGGYGGIGVYAGSSRPNTIISDNVFSSPSVNNEFTFQASSSGFNFCYMYYGGIGDEVYYTTAYELLVDSYSSLFTYANIADVISLSARISQVWNNQIIGGTPEVRLAVTQGDDSASSSIAITYKIHYSSTGATGTINGNGSTNPGGTVYFAEILPIGSNIGTVTYSCYAQVFFNGNLIATAPTKTGSIDTN